MLEPLNRWAAGQDYTRGDVWVYGEMIAEICRAAPINTVLELGTHHGASVRCWQELFSPSLMIGVELKQDEETRAALAELNVEMVYGDVNRIDVYREVEELLGDRRVDLIYFDADHSYAGMSRSYDLYFPLLRPGGVALFDDAAVTDRADLGTHLLVPELQQQHNTKLISCPLDSSYISSGVGSCGALVVWA